MATAELVRDDQVEFQATQVLTAIEALARPAIAGERSLLELRAEVADLAANGEWDDDSTARRLLVQMLRVEQAIDAATERGDDPELEVHRQLVLLGDLIGIARRRRQHARLDDPSQAAASCVDALRGIDDAEVGALLGVDPKTVDNWRRQRTGSVRKNRERIVLCAQLLFDLRRSWTPRGSLMWFSSAHPGLAGRTPIELIEQDPLRHAERLRELTRAERGQLDT